MGMVMAAADPCAGHDVTSNPPVLQASLGMVETMEIVSHVDLVQEVGDTILDMELTILASTFHPRLL